MDAEIPTSPGQPPSSSATPAELIVHGLVQTVDASDVPPAHSESANNSPRATIELYTMGSTFPAGLLPQYHQAEPRPSQSEATETMHRMLRE